MINAAADETPNAPAAASSPAVDPADPADLPDTVTPPSTTLPWGVTPHRMKVGSIGSSSATLAAEGASAAQDEPDTEPTPEFGPKGQSYRSGALLTQQTNVEPPPAPPGLAAEPVDGVDNVEYAYGVGKQTADTAGVAANMTIGKPKLAKEDWHSLAEIAAQSADGQQVIEVGWNVDRSINGDNQTHLFVFSWVDGGPQCYNGCGFIPAKGASIKPGDTLPEGVTKNFGVQHIGNAWWVAYDTEWVGAFLDKSWNGNFVRTGQVQMFGEVAASNIKPCTQMGDGDSTDLSTAARFSSVVYVDGPAVSLSVRTIGDAFQVNRLSDRTFRYGGPGGSNEDRCKDHFES